MLKSNVFRFGFQPRMGARWLPGVQRSEAKPNEADPLERFKVAHAARV